MPKPPKYYGNQDYKSCSLWLSFNQMIHQDNILQNHVVLVVNVVMAWLFNEIKSSISWCVLLFMMN
jgi:hypothetical protein